MKVNFNLDGLSTDSVKDAFRQAAKVPLGHEFNRTSKELNWLCGRCNYYEEAHAPIPESEVKALLSREDYMRAIMECSY